MNKDDMIHAVQETAIEDFVISRPGKASVKEAEVEKHFDWTVQRMGGKTYKFTSPNQRGVADRIACLPNGTTWFVELKTKGGRLSELQKLFQSDMARLDQKYACLWTKDQVDGWARETA